MDGQTKALVGRLRGILKDEQGEILSAFGQKVAVDPREDMDGLIRILPLLSLLPGITAAAERRLADEIERYANQVVGRVNEALDGFLTEQQALIIAANIRDHAARAARYLNLNDGSVSVLASIFDRAARGMLDLTAVREELRAAFDAAAARVEVVARTEVTYASEAVSRDAYRHFGIEKMMWVFGGGPCTTGICRQLDGKIININAGVAGVGGGFALIEGPPAHPNCTCFTLPVMEGGALAP